MPKQNDPKLVELRKIFETIGGRSGKPLSQATITNYTNKLDRLSHIVTGHGYDGDITWLRNYDDVMDKLVASPCVSKKDYLTGVSRILKHGNADQDLIDKYKAGMSKFKKEEDQVRGENRASQKAIDHSLTLSEINDKIDSFDPGQDKQRIMALLICCFYFKGTLVPRNDLPEMKLATIGKKNKSLSTSYNYIVSTQSKPFDHIIMNKYKTELTYGQQVFPITEKLRQVLTLYCAAFKKTSGQFLFTVDGQPISTKDFSDVVQDATEIVCGKRISINLIRSIIISDYYRVNHTINEDKEFAHRFLHSVAVGREYCKVNLPVGD